MRKSKKILIACLADSSSNPRPKRMISFCQALGYIVDVASFPLSSSLDINNHFAFRVPSAGLHHRIARKLIAFILAILPFKKLFKIFDDYRWGLSSLSKPLQEAAYDCIIVHDALLLPFIFRIQGDAKIILDAREYYPGEFENDVIWYIFDRPEKLRICKKYMPLCDKIMTVSQGIVDRYKADFNLDCTLVRSMPLFSKMDAHSVNSQKIKMVHHGGANRDRKLENMIDAVSMLDNRFELDFYLTGNMRYQRFLKDRAAGNNRIRFLEPVPFNNILPMLNNYDIGFYLLEPTGFNTEYSLPNKFFEFIQARLMLAIGPSPDMSSLIRKYNCGVIAEDFRPETMAAQLNALTVDDIMRMKSASDAAAKELCFEQECKNIIKILKDINIYPMEQQCA